jgi:hypothetical protein
MRCFETQTRTYDDQHCHVHAANVIAALHGASSAWILMLLCTSGGGTVPAAASSASAAAAALDLAACPRAMGIVEAFCCYNCIRFSCSSVDPVVKACVLHCICCCWDAAICKILNCHLHGSRSLFRRNVFVCAVMEV